MSAASLPVPAPEPGTIADLAWVEICTIDEIIPNTAVCALVRGAQIALVRYGTGNRVYAVGNFDPFSKAFVIARGIVGDRNGAPKIASPIFKQSFNLETGQCLDNPKVSLPVYPVRIREGRVELQVGG